MKLDLKQSWGEALEDKPRLQWEVLSVSSSLALLSELLPGTDVSLGFEPLPSVKLSFQTGVHCRQCKTCTELAQLGLIICFTMCSEYFLQLIIILHYSHPLLSSCLILWLKTMEFFTYCAFQSISSRQWKPWKLLKLSHGQKKFKKKKKIKQTVVIVEEIIDFCTILLSISASWQGQPWMSITEKKLNCLVCVLFTLYAFRINLVQI